MDRKKFTTTIEAELLRKIKILATENDIRANELIEEAIRLLLEKYKSKTDK